MDTIAKIRKYAAGPLGFIQGAIKGLGPKFMARPVQTATRLLSKPAIADRALGAMSGAFVGSDQGSRLTGTEGGGTAGMLGGAALGGMYGLSGSRFRGGPKVARPMVRNALTMGGAGQAADYAAGTLGYDTNFTGLGTAAGMGTGVARRLAGPRMKQIGRNITEGANTFASGAARPSSVVLDKLSQGWRKMQGKTTTGITPTGHDIARPFSQHLTKPGVGSHRAMHNLGIAAGAVPLAAGAYGVAGALGDRAVDHVTQRAGENIQGQMDEYLNARLPQLSQFAREQADDYVGERVPQLLNRGVDTLQDRGVLGEQGGVRINMPSLPNPAHWISSMYNRYAGGPSAVGQGYH